MGGGGAGDKWGLHVGMSQIELLWVVQARTLTEGRFPSAGGQEDWFCKGDVLMSSSEASS